MELTFKIYMSYFACCVCAAGIGYLLRFIQEQNRIEYDEIVEEEC